MNLAERGSTRKVLVLNHFATPVGAAGGTRHVELFARLDGWDARILAANRNLLTRERQPEDALLRTVWVSPYRSNGMARILSWVTYAITAFVAGLRERRVTVVYASSPHLLAGMTGWGLAKLKRVPLVVEVRDLWPQVLVDMGQLHDRSPVFRILKAAERFLYRHADAVVVLAQANMESVVADGARADRVAFLPNCADPADFEVEEPRADLRARFGMEGLVFLYAGAHGPANGLHFLLQAARNAETAVPDARFWLVGDGVSKQSLIGAAREMELRNVVFHDPVPKREIAPLLSAADVGLHVLADVELFRRGVSPNKLFDYMATGLPVLTNTPGEVAELVRAADSGLAVEPADLLEGIVAMSEAGGERRASWGANGKRFVADHRSRSAIAQRLEQLLDDVSRRGRIGRTVVGETPLRRGAVEPGPPLR